MTNTALDGHADLLAPREQALFAERYRLGRVLGRGGAATVHEAFDERLRRLVAIKVFRDDGDGDDVSQDTARRFVDEAHLLAGLRHPGLVEIYDFGRTPQGPYLVLELIPGCTLQQRFAAGTLPPREAARMGAALAHTLAYVHAAGVVHRDLKPSNVLLDEDGRPRLADFGVSRTLGTAGSTKTGNVVGTAAYLAPEQVLGQSAEPAADVYALGLVVIEGITGAREYPGPPVEAAVVRLHRPPCVPEGLPEELAQALRSMTATDPGDRPSAAECARILDGVAADGAPTVGVAWSQGWIPSPGRHQPVDVDASQASTQAAPTVWVPVPSDPPTDPLTGSAPRPEPRVRRGTMWSLAAVGVLAVTGATALTALPAAGRPATSSPAHTPAPATTTSPARSASGQTAPTSAKPAAALPASVKHAAAPATSTKPAAQPAPGPAAPPAPHANPGVPPGKGHGPGKKEKH